MDALGDRVRQPCDNPKVLLSVAQGAARASRERACRLLLVDSSRQRPEKLLAYGGAIRLLCDTVVLANLAGDNLEHVTCTRQLLKTVREVVRAVEASQSELAAAVDLYNCLCLVARDKLTAPTPTPASLALWGRSLACTVVNSLFPFSDRCAVSAECYFADAPKHYGAVLRMAQEKLDAALAALPTDNFDARARLRAEEALGRVWLLLARKALYSGEGAWESTLSRAASILSSAAHRAAGEECSTVLYDAARAAALSGDSDGSREWLERALHSGALPPLRVLRLEPDFSVVRDAPWFKTLASGALVVVSKGSSSRPAADENYAAVKKGLIENGFSQEPLFEHLRYPLYMERPRGVLVDSMVRQAEAQEASERKAEEGRARLHSRLREHGMKAKRDIPGDGNCQFSAISDQIYDTVENAAKLRATAVKWLRSHAEWDSGNGAALRWFVDGEWEDYCARIAKSGTWGDHLTLIALSESLGRAISVISSVEGDNFVTDILPSHASGAKVLLLSHYAEFHYGSLTYA